jgi:hypothetical protein
MVFFLKTASNIATAFVLIIKSNPLAIAYINASKAHWLLSWLVVVLSAFLYMLYLPTAFMAAGAQEILVEGIEYSDFKAAKMVSFTIVMFVSYLLVYLLQAPLGYTRSVRHYIISQNWLSLATILIFVPLSSLTSSSQGWSALASIMIVVFIFVLFFVYRCNKLILGISGLKAFLLLIILVTLEVILDATIDRWFGLVKLAQASS